MNMNSSESHLLNTVDHNAVAIVRKREGGRSRRKCIHENELNGETVVGHVPKLMALWLTKFLKRPTNKGRAVVKGKYVNRGPAMVWKFHASTASQETISQFKT